MRHMRLSLRAGATVGVAAASLWARAEFSQAEIEAVQRAWADKCRYEARVAGAPGQEWCVRLTPAGSKWIRELYRQFTTGKVVPTQDPTGNTPQQQAWVAWLNRAVARDRAAAEAAALRLNMGESTATSKTVVAPRQETALNRKSGLDKTGRSPVPTPQPQEDPCPAELVALIGAPPKFAEAVRPMTHVVAFPDGTELVYTDNVKVRDKYAYYRYAEGVKSGGEKIGQIPAATVSTLFRAAGVSPFEFKVMKAVSLLEGGFDSVNTYDTGLVSIGFIQFACLADGNGSLGEMMRQYKTAKPHSFQRDFRDYGVDVGPTGLLALDLESGECKGGAEAALQIIRDKRLTAVFQRAGLKSQDFRVAQIRAAKKQFYPADDTLAVNLGGSTVNVRIGDIVRSEAGMAMLMDRKVNTGKLAGLKESVERAAAQFGIDRVSDLADLEYQVVRGMVYRTDYLAVAGLAKPRDNSADLYRRGSRFDRKNDPASGGGGSRKGGLRKKG